MGILEICVDSVESAMAAEAGGAHRLELCSALSEGGLTPSLGLVEAVQKAVAIPIFVMVRPRGGDFCYTAAESSIMQRDISTLRTVGIHGVVLGVLLNNGDVDLQRTGDLIGLARPLKVTFHRAFDLTPDLNESLDRVIESGGDRILTSGGQQTALTGAATLRGLISRAEDRIAIMVGGGVREHNLSKIAGATRAVEFHAAPRKKFAGPMTYRVNHLSLGTPNSDEYSRYTVQPEEVRGLRNALDALQLKVPSKSDASHP